MNDIFEALPENLSFVSQFKYFYIELIPEVHQYAKLTIDDNIDTVYLHTNFGRTVDNGMFVYKCDMLIVLSKKDNIYYLNLHLNKTFFDKEKQYKRVFKVYNRSGSRFTVKSLITAINMHSAQAQQCSDIRHKYRRFYNK